MTAISLRLIPQGRRAISILETNLAGKTSISAFSQTTQRRTLSTSYAMQAKKASPSKKKIHKPLPYSPPTKQPVQEPIKFEPPPRSPTSMRGRTIPLVFGSLTAFATAAYLAILYVSYQRENAENAKAVVPLDVSERYNEIAPSFDDSIDSTERLMGLIKLRKKLAQEAYGDVCEVSIGTGRNLTYYDWNFKGVNGVGIVQRNNRVKTGKVNSFTAVDKSPEMLEIAHEKFSKEYPDVLGARWIVQDASKPLPPPSVSANERNGNRIGKKYDTIIQTMGLCSTPDPVALLKNLGNSVEPDGRILLLEHGQSTWSFVNNHLDRRAPRHAEEFGCWWNKDIGKIIEESGLEVVKIKRKHFGTTWWIELKPKKTDIASEEKSD